MTDPQKEILRLQFKLAALEELLAVHEAAVLQQSERLENMITELQKHERVLKSKNRELEELVKIMFDRESRILELKKQVNELLEALGKPEQYKAE